MNCPACGHENRETARFCGECAAPLAAEVACPACDTPNPSGQKFCDRCAAPLTAPEPGATVREPRAYTPSHLADRILHSKSALEGERKQVTVLFADVKGSMELAERIDPEEWHRILEGFFEILSEGVHRFEGTVNQYTGDGIMALFGAPIAHEDHPHRACYAALHLRDALRDFATDVKRRHGLDFAVRFGINSGEVVVGKIGDDLRMDYTAQGHTVGLAQRMESLASGGTIYAGEGTAGLVTGYFEFEDLGEFQVKGASETVRVFELSGAGAVRTRFDLSRARGLTRFVGRSDEMALVEAALEQALAGPGRTIGIVAQAGTGKSRLCYEFIERCRARGLPVYEGHGLAHGRQIPLLPALELLRAFFGIDERDGDRVIREKIAGRTLLLDESLSEELPILFDLLGAPDPARPLPPVDPEELQRRMLAAVRSLARADAELEPGVLLVEDLHWLDPASDALLEQVIEGTIAAKGLVLVNFRPEYRAHWMQQSHYQQLSLLPLSEDALRELLVDLLGDDPSVSELPDAIHARTGGNPFYIEEIVHSLVDEGHLTGARGAYRLVTPVRELPLPESVHALLAARIDRLPEREKHVLQAASVIGKTFREKVLARVVDLPDRDLSEALRHLQDAEFLYEAALYPEREYTFKHPLTQEVADRSQLSERRKRAHAAVARAIEELDAEHLDEHAALLAQHWEAAEEPVVAARWHVRAAGEIGRIPYADAFGHWQRVDALLRDVEGDEEAEELLGRAFSQELQLAFRVGIDPEEFTAIFQRGRAFHEARGDDAALARLLCAGGALLQTQGRLPEYLENALEASEVARRSGDLETRASVALDVVWAQFLRGRLDAAIAAADEAIALADGDAKFAEDAIGYSPLITTLAFSGYAMVFQGRLDEGEERIEGAFAMTSERTLPETLLWLTSLRMEVALARGQRDAALRSARRGFELAGRSGSRFDAVISRCWLSLVHVAREEWREASEQLDAGRALAHESRSGFDFLLTVCWAQARAALGLGDLSAARALADEAVALCTERRAHIVLCRSLIARAAVRRADPEAGDDAALADLDAAERLVEETGARLFLPEILEARASLARGEEAEQHLREAHRLYAEMGATGHAARVAERFGS